MQVTGKSRMQLFLRNWPGGLVIYLFLFQGLSYAQTPCQPVLAYFDTSACQPVPKAEGTHLYFDVCLGDTVLFHAYGVYPQNGLHYTQHDTLCTYFWTFGDGSSAITTEPWVKHKYQEARGYEMSFYMRDTNNCQSQPRSARIRITGNPIIGVTQPPPICLGDTVYLSASTLTTFVPFSYFQAASQKYDSTTFIPDGLTSCPPYYYVTDVVFNIFQPGQSITGAGDILSVCVNMEHGYMGDISMKLRCPSMQEITLKSNGSGGSKFLGQPACWFPGCSMSDVRQCDNQNAPFICDPDYNPAGHGWNYCWSQTYPNVGILGTQPTVGTNQIDSTRIAGGSGYFAPVQDFTNLIGCPLNGLWTIVVTDHAGLDNGYVFEWTLNLNPNLLPMNWGYEVEVDSIYIAGPGVVGYTGDSAIVVPGAAGNFDYQITVVDEFGCSWTITTSLIVNPLPDLNLGPDRDICAGENTQIQNLNNCEDCVYLWNTGQNTPSVTVNQTGIYTVEATGPNRCSQSDSILVTVRDLPVSVPIRHD